MCTVNVCTILPSLIKHIFTSRASVFSSRQIYFNTKNPVSLPSTVTPLLSSDTLFGSTCFMLYMSFIFLYSNLFKTYVILFYELFESSTTPSPSDSGSSTLILYVIAESVLLMIGSVKHDVQLCLTLIDTLELLPYLTRFLSLTSFSLSL